MDAISLILQLLLVAIDNRATVYGFNEWNCCDVGSPCPCARGAITASGEPFEPDTPSAAIPAPFNLRMEGITIGLRVKGSSGPCAKIRLNDKAHPRWIGKRGLDLSPAAVKAITGDTATKTWGGRVELCYLGLK